MSSYLDELFAPLDLLPARYHRKPQPQKPLADSSLNEPATQKPEPLTARVRKAVHATHDLHHKMWDEFAAALAAMLEPHAAIAEPVLALIDQFNTRFAAPLTEVGWHP